MLEQGQTFRSPGGGFSYEVIGPCCRLYDREELPYPSCSLQWKGKQPSWKKSSEDGRNKQTTLNF